MNVRHHTFNMRLNTINEKCNGKINENSKVVDIGCWDGYLTKEIKNKFNCDMHCADVIKKLNYDMPFVYIVDFKTPYENKEFDVALLIDTLHHVKKDDQAKLIKEAERIAKNVLIFESGGFFAPFIDIVLNTFTNMSNPLSFRSLEEWIKFLPNYYCYKIDKPFYYPLKQYFFELKK